MDSPQTKPRRKLRLILAVSLIALGALAWGTWSLVTSNLFFQRVLLPRLAHRMNAQIQVARAEIRPWQGFTFHELHLQPKDQEPLLEARKVGVRYEWRDLLRGRLLIHHLTIDSPRVNLTVDANGASNLDPILRAFEVSPEAHPRARPTDRQPLQLRLGQLEISDARIRFLRTGPARERLELTVDRLGLRVQDLGNDLAGRATLQAGFLLKQTTAKDTPPNELTARCEGRADFSFGPRWEPLRMQVNLQVGTDRTAGAWEGWTNLLLSVNIALEPGQLQAMTLQLARENRALATLTARGPLHWDRREGNLEVRLSDVDHRVLNLWGQPRGLDFGQTHFGLDVRLVSEQQGRKWTTIARWSFDPLEVRNTSHSTPPFHLAGEIDSALDLTQGTVSLQKFRLVGSDRKKPWLEAELTAPMQLSWQTNVTAGTDASLRVRVTDLDFATWKPLLGHIVPSGRLQLDCDLLSRGKDQTLQLQGQGQLQNLTLLLGTNRWTLLGAQFTTRLDARQLRFWTLTNTSLVLTHDNRPVLLGNFAGQGDLVENVDSVNLQATCDLPASVQLLGLPLPGTIHSGRMEVTASLSRRRDHLTTRGQAYLRDLSGTLGPDVALPPALSVAFALQADPDAVQLSDLDLRIGSFTRPDGHLALEGIYRRMPMSCVFTAKVEHVSHVLLDPWLRSRLQEPRLGNLALNARLEGHWQPEGASRFLASLNLTNLTFQWSNGVTSPPASVAVSGDLMVRPAEFQLIQARLQFDPSARAANLLSLQGSLRRLPGSGPWTGQLNLHSDSLDLTPVWELWQSMPQAQPSTTTTVTPLVEPAPTTLPLYDARIQTRIGRIFLRDLDLRDLVADAWFHTNQVRLEPLQLTLNGAPVRGTFLCDLSVPGYQYRLDLQARNVPLPALVSTFAPDRKGQIAGSATLETDVQGRGFTGPSLQQHLRGQVTFTATNLNLAVAQLRSPLLQTLVDVVLGLPDLIRNPAAGVTRMLGQLLGTPTTRSGWTERLLGAPLNTIHLHARAENGRVQIASAEIRSAAFQARPTGFVELAPEVARSSLHIPVHLALEKSLAEQIGQRGSAPDAYVPLPDLLTLRGTLAEPKADLNKLALAQLATTGGATLLRNLGGATADQAGNILGTIGQLLAPGQTATPTNAPQSTNPVPRLLDLLRPPQQ